MESLSQKNDAMEFTWNDHPPVVNRKSERDFSLGFSLIHVTKTTERKDLIKLPLAPGVDDAHEVGRTL